MSIAVTPSVVTMPADSQGCRLVMDFLVRQFPRVSLQVWQQRMLAGKVHWEDGAPITQASAYAPQKRIFYYREVVQEPAIPFAERILHQDDELLVACKPHFLPVTPGGAYVQECLLNRLRLRTGIATLAPIHRIDRETAGIVMFSVNPQHRGRYHQLFALGQVRKLYHAIAPLPADAALHATALRGRQWLIENRMVKGEPWFRMKTVAGEVNARSTVQCVDVSAGRGFFHLSPLTGKTHQLRVHMSGLGYPLENDRYYATLQEKSADDYRRPLQLLAKRIEFTDPLSGERRQFQSDRRLHW